MATEIDESKLPTPEEVFLELSIKNEVLGIVTIRPWYHLRRAKHFTALCLGTFGVSYVGSTFTHVMNKGRAREYLVGGGYLTPKRRSLSAQGMDKVQDGEFLEGQSHSSPKGESSLAQGMNKDHPGYFLEDGGNPTPEGLFLTYKDLMANLEWGDEASGEGREGVVIGAADVRKGLDPEKGTSGFAICTRDPGRVTFQCPFGEVKSGLDVVKKAVLHEPLTEVTITRCGAVTQD
ncbi:hypothetical protein SK128_021800 [Halocaridina rubra]|uniref:Uncharacterized protein n=1 Tax=Halocaridina rubra TaxID=373956 RepID=A0AAN8WNK4_HALRR